MLAGISVLDVKRANHGYCHTGLLPLAHPDAVAILEGWLFEEPKLLRLVLLSLSLLVLLLVLLFILLLVLLLVLLP
jgi:hypothetical protein